MREAVGGSILFYIILGFIAIFIVFIAIIMNYAAAYRTNNYVVNMIEQTEGQTAFDDTSKESLVGYLKSNNYNNGLIVTCSNNAMGSVFHVKTFVTFHIPIIDVGFPLEINNDTKTIYTEYKAFCDSGITYSDSNYPSVGCWSGSGVTGIRCN